MVAVVAAWYHQALMTLQSIVYIVSKQHELTDDSAFKRCWGGCRMDCRVNPGSIFSVSDRDEYEEF